MDRSKPGAASTGSGRRAVLELAERQGVVRPRDLHSLGIHRMALTRLTEAGLLERVGRGLYRLAEAEPMGSPDLVLVSARVPKAILGLVTALNQHGLTTEIPKVVDLLLPRGMSLPRIDYPPLRVFWASGASFSEGVMEVEFDGVRGRITTPAKTVADCFKFRRRIGIDVAPEALREGLAQRSFTAAEFARMAKTGRVLGIARPYLESFT